MDLTLPLQADYRLIFVSLPPLALLVACIQSMWCKTKLPRLLESRLHWPFRSWLYYIHTCLTFTDSLKISCSPCPASSAAAACFLSLSSS